MTVMLPVMNRTAQGYLHMSHEWSQFNRHIYSLLPTKHRRAAFQQLVDQELRKFQGTYVFEDMLPVEIAVVSQVVEHANKQGVERIAAWVEFPDEEHMCSFMLAWS